MRTFLLRYVYILQDGNDLLHLEWMLMYDYCITAAMWHGVIVWAISLIAAAHSSQ